MACLALLIPPAGLKPTLYPWRSRYSRMARVITRLACKVALTVSLPVEVLMKSEPAQVTGGKDGLHVRITTSFAELSEFIIKRLPVTGQNVIAGDNDIHLARA